MPKKKKNQKKEDTEKKGSILKEQIKLCNEHLGLDLSSKSAGSLLQYKLILESISQAVELKDKQEESFKSKMEDLYLSIVKTNLDLKISNAKAKVEKPWQKDLTQAEAIFSANHKKYEERKNLHNQFVDKGNKIQDERSEMIKKYEDERNELVKKSQDYVKSLQDKTDPENPERKKVIDENTRLKEEIQKQIDIGLQMKEKFEKQISEGGLEIKNFEETSKNQLQKTIESFQQKTQSGLLLNTSLKTELLQIRQKNQQLDKFKEMADSQYQKLKDEMNSKINESLQLRSDNLEMQSRINESQNDKGPLLALIKEQQTVMKKLNLMKSLNEKYMKEYHDLVGKPEEEKVKKKKKKKNKNRKKKKGQLVPMEHQHGGESDDGEEEQEHHHCCCHHDHGNVSIGHANNFQISKNNMNTIQQTNENNFQITKSNANEIQHIHEHNILEQ